MQLVDPEEIPAMERLTQEVLVLREKVAIAESRGQEATGNRRQQVVCHVGQAWMCLYFCWCSRFFFFSNLWMCWDALVLGSWMCMMGVIQMRGWVPFSTCLKGSLLGSPGVTVVNLTTWTQAREEGQAPVSLR